MELVGWVCTLLVLVGYYLNSIQKYLLAMLMWSIGDIGWIVYDISISNFSHMALSGTIILLNGYGIYRILNKKKK